MAVYGAVDVGLKRIGIAYSPDGKVVVPLNPVMRKNRNQASMETMARLAEFGVDTLIVGLPKGGASSDEMERRIRHFVSLLAFSGALYYQDEYGSSHEASEAAKGVFRQVKDGKVDSLAAKIILQRWLESSR